MTPQKNKSKITITAKHVAYGVVQFTLEATDAKAAFETWKQVVFSPRQWVVTDNSGNQAATPTSDCSAVDDI